jgi:hypothetical protein
MTNSDTDSDAYYLPEVHIFAKYAGAPQTLEVLAELIERGLLLPRHPVYKRGVALREAIGFEELRRCFARERKTLADRTRQPIYLSQEARRRMTDLAFALGIREPLPKEFVVSRQAAAPYRLPDLPELGEFRGLRISEKAVHRLIQTGLLLPDHQIQRGDGPLRDAIKFPEFSETFRWTYPALAVPEKPPDSGSDGVIGWLKRLLRR